MAHLHYQLGMDDEASSASMVQSDGEESEADPALARQTRPRGRGRVTRGQAAGGAAAAAPPSPNGLGVAGAGTSPGGPDVASPTNGGGRGRGRPARAGRARAAPKSETTITEPCPHCGKTFSSMEGFRYHETNKVCTPEANKSPPRFSCSLCQRRFTSETGLRYHVEHQVCERRHFRPSNPKRPRTTGSVQPAEAGYVVPDPCLQPGQQPGTRKVPALTHLYAHPWPQATGPPVAGTVRRGHRIVSPAVDQDSKESLLPVSMAAFDCDGPVWSLDIAPSMVPCKMFSPTGAVAVLAVAAHDRAKPLHFVGAKGTGPASIQLWSVPTDRPWAISAQAPWQCASLVHNAGYVECVQWCPHVASSDPEEDGARVGVLAAALGDGRIAVAAIPIFAGIMSPVATADYTFTPNVHCVLKDAHILTVRWHPLEPPLLLGGANDGSVGIWRVQYKDGTLPASLAPHIIVNCPWAAQVGQPPSVTGASWSLTCPHRFASASMDGVLRVWDYRDPFWPAAVHDKIAVPVHAISFSQYDDTCFVADDTGRISTWNWRNDQSSKVVQFEGPAWAVSAAATEGEDHWILVGGGDGTSRVLRGTSKSKSTVWTTVSVVSPTVRGRTDTGSVGRNDPAAPSGDYVAGGALPYHAIHSVSLQPLLQDGHVAYAAAAGSGSGIVYFHLIPNS